MNKDEYQIFIKIDGNCDKTYTMIVTENTTLIDCFNFIDSKYNGIFNNALKNKKITYKFIHSSKYIDNDSTLKDNNIDNFSNIYLKFNEYFIKNL